MHDGLLTALVRAWGCVVVEFVRFRLDNGSEVPAQGSARWRA